MGGKHAVASRRGEPRPGSAALALLGQGVPSLKLAERACELVLEAAEPAAAFDRDAQELRRPRSSTDAMDSSMSR